MLILGVDLGTTSVKVALIHKVNGAVIASESEETDAYNDADVSQAATQDVYLIFRALDKALKRLPADAMNHVVAIGICGQMHGCMLWRKDCTLQDKPSDDQTEGSLINIIGSLAITRLITWEDGRCGKEFLASLPVALSCSRIATGYGCATLFWMQRNQTDFVKKFECSGTVQDFLVARLCKLAVPKMSYHNADSWGYFNQTECAWETSILLESGFPVHLLPIVVLPGSIAGKTVNQWHGIPAGVPVLAALGDLQCSVRAAMETTKDAVINISTSAQLSYVHLHSRAADLAKSSIAVECHPFTTCSSLAVAASLNGGNVLVQFTSMLQRWISELGLECPDINTLFSKLLVLGEVPSAMQVSPQLYGERHCPGMLASVNNISISLPSLAETFTALCDGLIANIASMINNKELMNAGVERIIGTGKALVKNPILQASVRKHFSFPLVMKSGSDAAVGAAQFAMQAMNQADQDG